MTDDTPDTPPDRLPTMGAPLSDEARAYIALYEWRDKYIANTDISRDPVKSQRVMTALTNLQTALGV